MRADLRIRDPRFLMLFPPLQFGATELQRPDGTLALPYLDAALTRAGFHSEILDCSVGNARHALADTFFKPVQISERFVRVGLSPEQILAEVESFDIIAVTSIFTPQTSRVFEVAELIKRHYPDKILVAGGVNARSLRDHFFNAGFDVVGLSEGERPMVQLAQFLHSGTPSLGEIDGIAFKDGARTVVNPVRATLRDLDDLPMPAWQKLPNDKYWEIGRIWGGRDGWIGTDERVQYAAVFTSRGCPFRCSYCHIPKERGAEAGDIGDLRLHSVERVHQELEFLKALGVKHLFINDDSFLAKKKRVMEILAIAKRYDFRIADVNGVNIIHLFRQTGNDRLEVDMEMLEALHEAGFRKMSLPFEAGTQRVLDKYSTGKWNLSRCDTIDLVKKMRQVGIAVDGNFMIGYPDETPEELTETFMLARRHMDAGLVACGFFMVQPFPGTRLFDESIANGQLSKDWHWDELGWSKGTSFLSSNVSPDVLKFCWSLVWKLLNHESRTQEFLAQLRP